MKLRKIIACQIILFSMAISGVVALNNIYADGANDTANEAVVNEAADTTTDASEESAKGTEVDVVPEETTEAVPAAVAKFVNKKMALKSVTLESRTSTKLTWKKRSGADGYIIYRKQKGQKFKKIKKIKSKKKTSYIDKKVKYGKTYIYTIKAYKKYDGKTYYTDYNKTGIKKRLKVKKKRKNGYKYLYDMDNKKIKNVQVFLKNPKYCLKVNLTQSVMTVYAKDGKNGYIIPVKAYLCSGNTWDTTGTFSLGEKYRFRALYYNCYSQWASRIHDDILFHTVPYTKSQNPNSLDVKEYNKLGTPASHGCIRLQCVAVKWINDNCPSGTPVVMYKSDNPGALGKPKLEKLPSWHTWDPTDPTMKSKCKKSGCKHKEV